MRFVYCLALCATVFVSGLPASAQVEKADSAYLFAYASPLDEGRSGLKLAWSENGREWSSIGDGFSFLKCDYANWGGEKRMVKLVVYREACGGAWHCVWQLNGNGKEFGHAASENLTYWGRQSYFTDKQRDTYVDAAWIQSPAATVVIDGKSETGTMQKVAQSDIERVTRYADDKIERNRLYEERAEQDGERFAGLGTVGLRLDVMPEHEKPISDKLIGVFFEDINYGADGGLYAELVQNRDFEYSKDENWNVKGWGPTYAWSIDGAGAAMTVDTVKPIHVNNPHYAAVTADGQGAALVNSGYDGIVVKKGEWYDFSLFSRTGGKPGKIRVSLCDDEGGVLASCVVDAASQAWKKCEAKLQATASSDAAVLRIEPLEAGRYDMDMISLFPRNTFKGRKNGLRADLAQAIADIHPRFVRFPGGCVAHGQGLDNIYRWKNSVGPLEARKPMKNLWGYHQTLGLGYFEYFLFCEDIGAEPLPVIAAGVPCQNSACVPGKLVSGGQQGGVPLDEMDEYIQDILDLIDYTNGNPETSKWARLRAEAGHPEPFNLKYIGIGNEDLITDVFEVRFTMIYEALKKHHPEITVIGTVGPFYEGTDYVEGWKLARRLGLPMVDEHYYNSPGWFIYNQDFYDSYDRSGTKVYLGEYAAHLPGRPNNIETALSEALYLTSIERNGDVVAMTSYAPLLAKEGHTQWNPDMIYFDSKDVKRTVGYHVQRLYGLNAGDRYIPADKKIDSDRRDVTCRIGTSVVRDSKTGDVILKMVNMLPVEVDALVNMPMVAGNVQATVTVLDGTPTDKDAVPAESEMSVSDEFSYVMPAYSFTVIRFNPGRNK